MSGKWYNTTDTEDTAETQKEDSAMSVSQKLLEFLSNIVPIFGAMHVGLHFGSIFYGLAMFMFLIISQAISTFLLMSKDELLEFAEKKMKKVSDIDLNNYVRQIYKKYLPTTSVIAICMYFAVRIIFKF